MPYPSSLGNSDGGGGTGTQGPFSERPAGYWEGAEPQPAQIPASVANVSASSPSNAIPVLYVTTSAQLVTALATALSIGGALIQCSPGTYIGNFILPPKTVIDGMHPSLVTLTQANGANGDVVQGRNFLTLTGKAYAAGDYALGCPEAGVRNCTIDGNKANNATGYSIRMWGRATILDNVEVQNGPQGDIWTEFTDVDSFSDAAQKLEGRYYRIRSSNSGGDGWTFRGPHDSVIYGMESYNHAAWAFTSDSVANSYQGSARLWEHNSYLCTSGDVRTLNNGAILMYGGSMTGANVGTGFQSSAASGACKLIGVQVAGRLIYFDLRAQNHQIIANIANSPPGANSDIVKLNGCSGCQVILEGTTGDIGLGFNCNIVNAVTDNLNAVSGIVNAGLRTTLVAGIPNASSRIDLQTLGNGGNSARFQLGPTNQIYSSSGFHPAIPNSNGTLLPGGGTVNTGQSGGGTQNIDASTGWQFEYTVTDATAFTIANPTNPTTFGILNIVVFNNSGGAMGAITWGGNFHLAGGTFTNPATGKSRAISFQWVAGLGYIEISRSSADV
jgi:hypothetical protein